MSTSPQFRQPAGDKRSRQGICMEDSVRVLKEEIEALNARLAKVVSEVSSITREYNELLARYMEEVGKEIQKRDRLLYKYRWRKFVDEIPNPDMLLELRSSEQDGDRIDIAYMDEDGEFWDTIGDSLRFKPVYWRYPDKLSEEDKL